VASWLGELGAVVVDADQLARAVVEPGEPALDAILARFGPTVQAADGGLDRAALGRIVFADPAELRDLEAIVHPAVRPRIEAAVADAERHGAPAVVIEAIKLVEAGYAAQCDEVWLVTCSPEEQRARVARRGHPPDEVARRIDAQQDAADRHRAEATRVIDTSGAREATRAAAESSYRAALAAAARG
jgi:dephospho-CoA kinase